MSPVFFVFVFKTREKKKQRNTFVFFRQTEGGKPLNKPLNKPLFEVKQRLIQENNTLKPEEDCKFSV